MFVPLPEMFSFTSNVLGNSPPSPKIGWIFFLFLSLQFIGKSWIDYQSTNINCAKLNVILTHQNLLYLFYHTILQCLIRHILIGRPAFLGQCVRVGMFSFTLNVLGNSAQCPKIGQIFFIFLSLQSIGKSRMDYQSASTCCAKLSDRLDYNYFCVYVLELRFFSCSRSYKLHFSVIFLLKMGTTALFTYLKIISLQYFQFQFSVSAKISSIQTHPKCIFNTSKLIFMFFTALFCNALYVIFCIFEFYHFKIILTSPPFKN